MKSAIQKQFTQQRIFEILHQIPLDIEGSNIANIGIVPLSVEKQLEYGWIKLKND